MTTTFWRSISAGLATSTVTPASAPPDSSRSDTDDGGGGLAARFGDGRRTPGTTTRRPRARGAHQSSTFSNSLAALQCSLPSTVVYTQHSSDTATRGCQAPVGNGSKPPGGSAPAEASYTDRRAAARQNRGERRRRYGGKPWQHAGRRGRENTPKRFTVMHLLKASAQPKTARGPTRVHRRESDVCRVDRRTNRPVSSRSRGDRCNNRRGEPGEGTSRPHRTEGPGGCQQSAADGSEARSATNRRHVCDSRRAMLPRIIVPDWTWPYALSCGFSPARLARRANTDRQSHECPPSMRHAGTIRCARSSPRSRPGSCSSSCCLARVLTLLAGSHVDRLTGADGQQLPELCTR